MREQITHFTRCLSETFYAGLDIMLKKTWGETFDLLTRTMNKQVPKDKRIVLFFDER